MTPAPPAAKNLDASAFRDLRLKALSWLWQDPKKGRGGSTLPRVRACRLHVSDVDAGVTLRRYPNGSASWVGLQTCGSTWACPACAEAIQAARQGDVTEMLARARAMGLLVAFITFTVRHHRTNSLGEVWSEVGDAWRRTTSGDPRAWNEDRDEFGVVGYLRLWETTVSDTAGWHVHVHALVFLDPNGRTVTKRAPVPLLDHDHDLETSPAMPEFRDSNGRVTQAAREARGYTGSLFDLHAPCPGYTAYDPCACQGRRRFQLKVSQSLPRVRHLRETCPPEATRFPCKRDDCDDYGTDHGHTWSYRRPEGPLPAPTLVADARKFTRTGPATVERIASSRAADNYAADVAGGKRTPALALYRRDAVDLAARMFARWQAALPEGMAPPSACHDPSLACSERRRTEGGPHTHGYDVRVVKDGDALAEYFTKNTLTIKGTGSTAHDVTASYSKVARTGNRTPFGLLADLVADDYDDDAARRRDRGLWREWETSSKGRRQLRPSDGLRDYLGMGPDLDDAALAADEPADLDADDDALVPVDLATVTPAEYRRLAQSGDHGFACDLAERWMTDVLAQLLDAHGCAYRGDDVGLARPHVVNRS